jgi:cardiolipin synthase
MVEPRPNRRAIATLPNALSLLRIAAIPAVVALIVRDGTEVAGLVLFGLVAATDWVDGYLARRTGQVTELGTVLDPLADRLAIAAALVAVVVRDAFPLWAAIAILARDGIVLVVGVALLLARGIRIEVRRIGKAATLLLMVAVPSVAWGGFSLPLGPAFRTVGWVTYAVGIAQSYAAAGLYAVDVRRALASDARRRDAG